MSSGPPAGGGDTGHGVLYGAVDTRMTASGYEELRFLWDEFKRLKVKDLSNERIEKLQRAHKNLLVDHPALLYGVALLIGFIAFCLSHFAPGVPFSLFLLCTGSPDPFRDAFIPSADLWFDLSTGLGIAFIACVAIIALHRTVLFPWRMISALDFGFMVTLENYRRWFEGCGRTEKTLGTLKSLGINEYWDNPSYCVFYEEGDDLAVLEPGPSLVQKALRDVLGFKKQKRFHPGRYIESLKDKKESVTEFIDSHQEKIELNKKGGLPAGEGIELLKHLRDCFMKAGSEGFTYLSAIISALENDDSVPEGFIKASAWERDPWKDLTRQKDFYSSASLRTGSLKDTLQRRTKGMLGPFGYMRNKSISALDFSTKEGRKARARLAACLYRDAAGGEQALLFVDGVEGRASVKPSLIKKAIEDYALRCGFRTVCYYRYPLNKVPERFVRHVAGCGHLLEEITLSYADSSTREYLDAFGLPFEPYEYAFPRGKVLGYAVDLDDQVQREKKVPSRAGLFAGEFLRKGLLHALTYAAIAFGAFMMYRSGLTEPLYLYLAVMAALLAYDAVYHRRALRVKDDKSASMPMPEFITEILEKINQNPLAAKMGYGPRALAKAGELLKIFPSPRRALRYFFEEVLYNVSIKDSDLENMLKFLPPLQGKRRKALDEAFSLFWRKRDCGALERALSEEKEAREALKQEVVRRARILQKMAKIKDIDSGTIGSILRVSRAMRLDVEQAVEMTLINTRILKGLWKTPRPLATLFVPLLYLLLFPSLISLIESVSGAPLSIPWCLIIFALPSIGASYFITTRLPVAPGILTYRRTGEYMGRVFRKDFQVSAVQQAMARSGIDTGEFGQGRVYENREKGVRIVIHDKRTLEGAVGFLTSGEEVGNCIALNHAISWTLPPLLCDDSVMLGDIHYRGSQQKYQQRGQVWMIAALEGDTPVLTVNSFEFNNEGAKHLDELMPEAVKAVLDVARKGRFSRVYAGITEFARDYLDGNFRQARAAGPVKKIHTADLGFSYYFDAYALRINFARRPAAGDYVYLERRDLGKRLYALSFALVELLSGNRAKCRAFLDTVKNAHNMWELSPPGNDAEA
ncbi:MAG: hypothetical protein RDV48_15110 [Candidatus Eremiobacteraeota bacterium]|nr:hypothetical protein [Candidatus Eremiobacteraeota bacterium]